jgi:hypothetical protein
MASPGFPPSFVRATLLALCGTVRNVPAQAVRANRTAHTSMTLNALPFVLHET